MRKALLTTVFVAALLSAFPAFAQSPNFDPGPVWRVTYYHLKPGQGDAFWKDFREHTKPIFEEFKKAGLISVLQPSGGPSRRLGRRYIDFLSKLRSA